MRRIYFLSPNRPSCRALVADLEQMDVPEDHIHVVGFGDGRLVGLPGAGVMTRSRVVCATWWGMFIGALAGSLGGLLFDLFPPAGMSVSRDVVVLGFLGGGAFGAAVSALVGKEVPHHDIEAFDRELYQGKLLVLVDIPAKRVDEISAIIAQHHPEADLEVCLPPNRAKQRLKPAGMEKVAG